LIVSVRTAQTVSLEQIRAFLEASEEVQFAAQQKEQVYAWVERTLREQGWNGLGRASRGLVRRYLEKMTGLSRAQITRLIQRYSTGGSVQPKSYRRHRFASRYSRADIELLAKVDEAHETLSGPATQKILQREFEEFGNPQYEQLAQISVAHLYRLRKSRTYRERRVVYQPTRPTTVAIGERRVPQPEGRPGYLRVDTVHQGDLEGVKGVYHINAVDEVTQWQVVGATAQISEAWLIPVVKAMLAQFPFRIRGFHSDNGSEFINHTVAGLLNKLLIEQTKSRPRHSNDNGLVESKNGAVVRKHMGYGHIAAPHAEAIERFYEEHFNPYLNFHRPCGVPEQVTNAKGKQKRVYRWYATPWEILRQLPGVAEYLRPRSRSRACNNVHAPTAIRKQHGRCRKQNANCSRACARRKRHEDGCGNDGPWTRWKTKGRFPTAPTALGNRKGRDSHIPTAATRSGKVENEKHVSHFPAHGLCLFSKTQKGGPAADRFAPAPGSFFDEKMLPQSCLMQGEKFVSHTRK
jgi:transposase InsO family protein